VPIRNAQDNLAPFPKKLSFSVVKHPRPLFFFWRSGRTLQDRGLCTITRGERRPRCSS
jgi:hypothetical protein